MNCIYAKCDKEATHTLRITEEETAPLGDMSSALHVFPDPPERDPLPYCDDHAAQAKERFKYFKYTIIERIEE